MQIQQQSGKIAKFCQKAERNQQIILTKILRSDRERCKRVHCVDLGESFPTIADSNEYLLSEIGVDTAENEPLEVWGKIFNIIHWCP